jgi:hypothetical protein
MAAEAVTTLPLAGKVLKGAWEKLTMPNIDYSLKCYFFPVSNGFIPFIYFIVCRHSYRCFP